MNTIITRLLNDKITLLPTFEDVESLQQAATKMEIPFFYNHLATCRSHADPDCPLYVYGARVDETNRTCLFLDNVCPDGDTLLTKEQLLELSSEIESQEEGM